MDDVPLCPEWWPRMLWQLHFPLKFPSPHGPVPPVNDPPVMNDILANLHIHTLSYLSLDQESAKQIRMATEKRLVEAVRNLSAHHDQSVQRQNK